jgi:hypothetical protein
MDTMVANKLIFIKVLTMDVLARLASPLIGLLLLEAARHPTSSTSSNAGNDPLANPACGSLVVVVKGAAAMYIIFNIILYATPQIFIMVLTMDVLARLASLLILLLTSRTAEEEATASSNAGNDPLANPGCGWQPVVVAWEAHLKSLYPTQ